MGYVDEKKEVIYWAFLLNQKGFVTARSGNISMKLEDGLLITSHECYLGHLTESDILLMDLNGNIIEGKGELTSEKTLHLDIHKKFEDIKVIIHSHSPYTTAFFHYFRNLDIFSFEGKFYLGEIKVIPQKTPIVTDTAGVLCALENNNIVVLGGHGVVAIGKDFKQAFSLIELLEEQAKVSLMLKVIKPPGRRTTGSGCEITGRKDSDSEKKYKLLSREHIERLVELVNNDSKAQALGQQYDLTCTLAVKNQETGDCVCFYYEKGKIVETDNSGNAEFMIIGKETILKKVFNRELDPFVASTQGKVKTKGDFAKMSKWYPVLVRTFKLWEQAAVI